MYYILLKDIAPTIINNCIRLSISTIAMYVPVCNKIKANALYNTVL